MPMLYCGKHFGYMEQDVIIEQNFGDQGTTRIGAIYPKNPDPEKARKNRETLVGIAQKVAERVANEEYEREELAAKK